MKTITLIFNKEVLGSKDSFGNPVISTEQIEVPGCLIAPITEPTNEREAQALQQELMQVRIHLPKTFTGDIGNSTVEYGGITWRVDSDSVQFMDENCPTQWNRYFRGEAIHE